MAGRGRVASTGRAIHRRWDVELAERDAQLDVSSEFKVGVTPRPCHQCSQQEVIHADVELYAAKPRVLGHEPVTSDAIED